MDLVGCQSFSEAYNFNCTDTISGGPMKHHSVSTLLIIIAFGCQLTWSQGLPTVAPEDVGISSPRLARIDEFVERHLEAGHFAGAVTVVARRGKVVQFKAYGMQNIESDVPMSKDSIFRIYSMSKPITSVAVMMLFEEGHFLLNDPVSRYLPEFKGIEVGVEKVDEASGERVLTTVAAQREVSIRDLLRHTSGLSYGLWGESLVDEMYLEREILLWKGTTIQDTVAKLAAIPLKHQPGTVWQYGLSTDVLGRLVEVISGEPLDEFFEQRIFSPLGMKDTGFFVPPEKADRLTTVYTPNGDNTAITPYDPDSVKQYTYRTFTEEVSHFSGGGGLVSTAADYLRFSQMLLNGGKLDGVRILGPKTVDLMTRNHLGDITMWDGAGGYGFGLGFMIYPDPGTSGDILSEGSFAWGGMAHTGFWVDPKEELIGVFMSQILPEAPLPYSDLFAPVVYQAIID
jgi:CubicO group peptidase (beta-lactamase class C family)